MSTDRISLKPIGYVKNDITDPDHDVWDRVISTIQLIPQMADGLQGMEAFSHVLVIFVLNRNRFSIKEDLVGHPFDNPLLPEVGVFARRSQKRPNPLAVTTVIVRRVEPAQLVVQGLDAVNGSPVVDLKAFDPIYDAVADPVIPSWLSRNLGAYGDQP